MRHAWIVLASAVIGLVAMESPAAAGWNNVFQTCCDGPSRSTRSSFFAPESNCCQKIEYVQRAYYTPVTVWKRESFYEPVTVRYRSYYWESVTTTQYTSYYDPCTGCSRSVAEPRTSYRLRSQMNCAQRYVQRCRMVPVTEQRVSYYMEPVVRNYEPVDPCAGGGTPMRAPVINESGGAQLNDPQGGAPARMPSTDERIEKTRIPSTDTKRNKPVEPRLDRVTSGAEVMGRLMREDRFTPQSYATVTLVNRKNTGERKVIETDQQGRFRTQVPAGEWAIYVPSLDGRAVFHSVLATRERENRNVMIVSQ
jgi:hypothetical protein